MSVPPREIPLDADPGLPARHAGPRVLVVVPVYDHGGTLARVAREALAMHPRVLVVDDGSTDLPPGETAAVCGEGAPQENSAGKGGPPGGPAREEVLRVTPGKDHPLRGLPVACLRHTRNRGKGAAIMTAAREAARLGMTHILTIDADGQHDPADIPLFLEAAAREPDTLFVGLRDFSTDNVPFSSRFGRAFSNFWYKVHTGESTGDVQSGFRLYPLSALAAARCSETRYGFEVEILVRASWAGFAVKNLPVRVTYPPRSERVSHFRPLADNIRISLLNTRLTVRAITPIPQRKYRRDAQGRITALHPLRSLRLLLADRATPANLALSAAVGIGLGTLPLIGLHSILILLVTGALRLNKITGLAVSQLCMPPLVPALCVEAGHYMLRGRFLTEISLRTVGYEALDRLWEWALGSLVLAPAFALLCGGTVFALAALVRKSLREEKPEHAAQGPPSLPDRGGASLSLPARDARELS